jgi:hypothetical protein
MIELCECRQGCQCQEHPGPAAFLIERRGQQMKVCTRCDLPSDTFIGLLVTDETEAKPFADYDFLGTLVMAWRLKNQEEAAP